MLVQSAAMIPKVFFASLLVTCAVWAQTTQPAAPSGPAFTVKQVGNGVYAAISVRAGGNTGFIVGDDAVLVVDTFINQAAARELLAEIRKITNLPVKYVVNTHYHMDHVAGNAVFTEAGAAVIGNRNMRGWVRTENLKFFRQNGATPTAEQSAMVAAFIEPQITYDHILEVSLGRRVVRVVALPGHTGGDSVVYVPDADVVFAGDLAWRQRIPNLIDATTSAWIETLAAMLKAHPSATFIPGHGDVAAAADIASFASYLKDLRASIGREVRSGKTGEALKSAVMEELKPSYGSWGGFDRLVPLNVEQTAAEMDGTKKVPQPASE
ncbi:MAG: MBL fold metallo-hydrolase [Acidobacteria bacterium]|nr:MBL fold metallo-hydrolase [Acidobacteriota bacterium]